MHMATACGVFDIVFTRYLSKTPPTPPPSFLIRYESAEGCYALAVSQRQDLRVKYAVKAFTDAAGGSEIAQEVSAFDNLHMCFDFQVFSLVSPSE